MQGGLCVWGGGDMGAGGIWAHMKNCCGAHGRLLSVHARMLARGCADGHAACSAQQRVFTRHACRQPPTPEQTAPGTLSRAPPWPHPPLFSRGVTYVWRCGEWFTSAAGLCKEWDADAAARGEKQGLDLVAGAHA